MTTRSLATALVATPTSELAITKVVVLDWVDGPLEGFLSVANPRSDWHFRIVANNARTDDIDDRLFGLALVSDLTMTRVLEAVAADPEKVTVIPEPSDIDEAVLGEVMERLGPPEVFALLDLPQAIERVWLVEPS